MVSRMSSYRATLKVSATAILKSRYTRSIILMFRPLPYQGSGDIVAWQNRPLEPVYLIGWMVSRENSKVINKTVYIAVGLRRDDKKEVLGLWLGKEESAAFWMRLLTDISARGTEGILITATDNLYGFIDTIKIVFPEPKTWLCIVYQISNACRYGVWKDKKAFTAEMKHIYNAPN